MVTRPHHCSYRQFSQFPPMFGYFFCYQEVGHSFTMPTLPFGYTSEKTNKQTNIPTNKQTKTKTKNKQTKTLPSSLDGGSVLWSNLCCIGIDTKIRFSRMSCKILVAISDHLPLRAQGDAVEMRFAQLAFLKYMAGTCNKHTRSSQLSVTK